MPEHPTYEELFAMVMRLQVIVAEQAKEIASLKEELARYKTPKNSGNSHKPPSTDIQILKRNQNLREKSGKKAGGQPGHKGHTLEMKETPDKVIEHKADLCCNCGCNISDVAAYLVEKRQVVDIPAIQAVWLEHRVYGRRCHCGHSTNGSFPWAVNAPVQYGSSVEALVAYFHARQYLPVQRMSELFEHVLGLPVSESSIVNMINRFAQKAQPAYEEIKKQVMRSGCVGSDETGCKVNGKKQWFWTWQNLLVTLIVHAKSRGSITIEQTFPQGLPGTVLVSDRLAAQLGSNAKDHQICTVHLLRDLNYIEQLHESSWARDFKALIKEAIALDRQLKPEQYGLPNAQRDAFEARLRQLLAQPIPRQHHEAATLQKQLNKIPQNILLFLHHADVPSHNNGSEKAIRNVKVKQKISGQFKSDTGAKAFATIRSVIDTAIKAGKQVLNELFLIAQLAPAPA